MTTIVEFICLLACSKLQAMILGFLAGILTQEKLNKLAVWLEMLAVCPHACPCLDYLGFYCHQWRYLLVQIILWLIFISKQHWCWLTIGNITAQQAMRWLQQQDNRVFIIFFIFHFLHKATPMPGWYFPDQPLFQALEARRDGGKTSSLSPLRFPFVHFQQKEAQKGERKVLQSHRKVRVLFCWLRSYS